MESVATIPPAPPAALLTLETPRTGLVGVPTGRAALLVAGGAVLLMAWAGSAAGLRAVLGLDGVLVLACVLDYLAARRVRLEVRRLPHGKLNLGAPNPITLRVRNLGANALREQQGPWAKSPRSSLELMLNEGSPKFLRYLLGSGSMTWRARDSRSSARRGP